MMKRFCEDDIDSVLELADRLVMVPVIVEMLRRVDITRTHNSVMGDAARGHLKMGKISGRYLVTTEAEARRYVQAMVDAKKRREPRGVAAQRVVDRMEQREALI